MRLKTRFGVLALLAMTTAFGLVVAFSNLSAQPAGKLLEYHGMSEQHVIDALGKPTREDQFSMPTEGSLDEFRCELCNFYPPNPNNANGLIRELHWKDGQYNITIWLHQPIGNWIVLDSCRWHESIRF